MSTRGNSSHKSAYSEFLRVLNIRRKGKDMRNLRMKQFTAMILTVCIVSTSMSWDGLVVHAESGDISGGMSGNEIETTTGSSIAPEAVTPEDEIVEERTELFHRI